MKRPLTHCDFTEGKRYKVIKRPEHLKGVQYIWLNMVGVCKWSNAHNGVLMAFGECKERLIPHNCLEAVEEIPTQMSERPPFDEKSTNDALILFYTNLGNEQKAKESKVSLDASTAKVGNLYRIIKVPPFWNQSTHTGEYPSLQQIGRLVKVHRNAAVLIMSHNCQRFVPFDCMEEVEIRIPPAPVPNVKPPVIDLTDDKLIDAIIANPRGALRIVKGLAKMNKDIRLITFVQRGILV